VHEAVVLLDTSEQSGVLCLRHVSDGCVCSYSCAARCICAVLAIFLFLDLVAFVWHRC